MHQGNLLIDKTGTVAAVDFRHHGTARFMERPVPRRDPARLYPATTGASAAIHFEAGYWPPHHRRSIAQAMRAIGSPPRRTAPRSPWQTCSASFVCLHRGIRYADAARAAAAAEDHGGGEGVARALDPDPQHVGCAEPIAKEWVELNYGLAGASEAGEGPHHGPVLAEVPRLLERRKHGAALAEMARGGLRLDATASSASPPPRPSVPLEPPGLWVGPWATAIALWLLTTMG